MISFRQIWYSWSWADASPHELSIFVLLLIWLLSYRELNLKIKQASPQTSSLTSSLVTSLPGSLPSDHPNNDLYPYKNCPIYLRQCTKASLPKPRPTPARGPAPQHTLDILDRRIYGTQDQADLERIGGAYVPFFSTSVPMCRPTFFDAKQFLFCFLCVPTYWRCTVYTLFSTKRQQNSYSGRRRQIRRTTLGYSILQVRTLCF